MRDPLMKRRVIEIGERQLAGNDDRIGLVAPQPERRHHREPGNRESADRGERELSRGPFSGLGLRLGHFADSPSTPGMKASKAAQN